MRNPNWFGWWCSPSMLCVLTPYMFCIFCWVLSEWPWLHPYILDGLIQACAGPVLILPDVPVWNFVFYTPHNYLCTYSSNIILATFALDALCIVWPMLWASVWFISHSWTPEGIFFCFKYCFDIILVHSVFKLLREPLYMGYNYWHKGLLMIFLKIAVSGRVESWGPEV